MVNKLPQRFKNLIWMLWQNVATYCKTNIFVFIFVRFKTPAIFIIFVRPWRKRAIIISIFHIRVKKCLNYCWRLKKCILFSSMHINYKFKSNPLHMNLYTWRYFFVYNLHTHTHVIYIYACIQYIVIIY